MKMLELIPILMMKRIMREKRREMDVKVQGQKKRMDRLLRIMKESRDDATRGAGAGHVVGLEGGEKK